MIHRQVERNVVIFGSIPNSNFDAFCVLLDKVILPYFNAIYTDFMR